MSLRHLSVALPSNSTLVFFAFLTPSGALTITIHQNYALTAVSSNDGTTSILVNSNARLPMIKCSNPGR
jgi:hypothetical protein